MMMIAIAAMSSMAVLLFGARVKGAPFGREQSCEDEFRDTGVAERRSAILPDIPSVDHPHATMTERDHRDRLDHGEGAACAEEVYDRYYRLLSSIATRTFAIPRDDVEPLAHDAFVAFFRNRHRVQNHAAWLVGVMYNLCREYWRAKGHEERARLTFAPTVPKPFDTASARVDLERALRRLPERSLVAIRLRFFEGLSIEEVAANLGVTPENVRQIIHRGLLKARERFALRGRE
jgi:RNA polymerase sigma factor (sigma-70 family)